MFALVALLIGLIWLLSLWILHRRAVAGRSVWLAHEDLLAGGLLFLLMSGFFWRTISGDVFQPADGGDLVSFLFPTYRFAAAQFQQGLLPLWNPYLYGGAPFISDVQAGFLYPPNLLLFWLNPYFDYTWMQTLAQLHIYWAALGMYVLLRALPWGAWRPSRPAAFLGALAFALSDPLLTHLGNLNLIAVLSWLPWVLATYIIALHHRDLRWCALSALLFALANYAGHAQSSYYIGLALVIYTLLWWIIECEGWRIFGAAYGASNAASAWPDRQSSTALLPSKRLLLYLPLVAVLTFLLSAPILLPVLEMTQFTERADLSYQETVAFSLAPTQAIGLLTPNFFGRGPALHWSLWDRVETPYAGIVTLLLGLAGLLLAPWEQRRRLWPWLGVGLFGLTVALGVYAILHGWLYALLPGFAQFRAPARALVLWTLGLAVLAAAGVDGLHAFAHDLSQRMISHAGLPVFDRLVRWIAFVLAGIAAPLLYVALLLTQGDEAAFLHTSVAALAVTIAAFFWLATWSVIAAYRAGWMRPQLFPLLLIGLLFAELSANGGAYQDVSSADPTRGFQHPEIVEFLKSDSDLFRIDTRTDIGAFWQPDAAALLGLQDVWGVANPLLLQHWARLWESTGGRQTRLYDLLNVKYVLVQDGAPLPEGKFELALDAPGELAVYRNHDFWPRAWVVHEVQAAPDADAAFAQLRADGLDPTRQAIIETADALPPATSAHNADVVTIERYGANAITVQAATEAPGLLLLSEVWYPGWRATVNDAPADVLRVDGALRGVALPAGASTVQLWFAPTSWRWGLGGLLFGILFCLAIIWRFAQ
ncbi:MAG: hypothetical protein R3A44_21185 [Caldilineaceae bacterium]